MFIVFHVALNEVDMGVLFMMPVWDAPSEVWMQRMLEELGSDLKSVVCWDTNGEKRWRNSARAISLFPQTKIGKIFEKSLNIVGIPPKTIFEKKLLQEMGKNDIDKILVNYGEFASNFMTIWQRTSIPLFIHFHGYDATFNLRNENNPNKLFFPASYLENIIELSKRSVFIANSNFTKSLLISAGIPENVIHIKYLGVPIPKQIKQHNNKKKLRILHLGRLVDFKSPDRTLQAFEIVRNNGIDSELIIAGDGPLRVTCELMRSRSKYRESIHLLGAVDSQTAQALLSTSDIFTQHNIEGEITKQSECFGVSIIEAMAAGLPIVGTKHGGVLETVVDGETGFLVTPGDVEGQANAIITLHQNPQLRQKLGNKGRLHVQNKFSYEIERKRLQTILNMEQ